MIPEEYLPYSGNFPKMHTHFESMWEDQSVILKAVQQQIELKKTDTRPRHAAPYKARKKVREFEKHHVNQMIATDAVEPNQTEWAS